MMRAVDHGDLAVTGSGFAGTPILGQGRLSSLTRNRDLHSVTRLRQNSSRAGIAACIVLRKSRRSM